MGSSTNLKDASLCVTPSLETLEFFSGWNSEFLSELHLVCLFIDFESTFGSDLGGCEDSSELGTEEMSLLTRERWVRVDLSVEVTSHDMLDQTGKSDILRLAFGQLNPIVQEVVSDPVYVGVNTSTTSFDLFISQGFLSMSEGSTDNPVVCICA
jgi:hypothetical protein